MSIHEKNNFDTIHKVSFEIYEDGLYLNRWFRQQKNSIVKSLSVVRYQKKIPTVNLPQRIDVVLYEPYSLKYLKRFVWISRLIGKLLRVHALE